MNVLRHLDFQTLPAWCNTCSLSNVRCKTSPVKYEIFFSLHLIYARIDFALL